MPELIWDGKEVEPNVPVRALDFDDDLSCGDGDNLIVHGDNLEAMTALLRFYRGRVKCIYIDPPYNTGVRVGSTTTPSSTRPTASVTANGFR